MLAESFGLSLKHFYSYAVTMSVLICTYFSNAMKVILKNVILHI